MKKTSCLASLAICLSMATARAEPTIDSSKAAFYVGKEAMVCGTVFEVKPFSKGTYINMGARYPNQHITFLVWDSELPKFNQRFGRLDIFKGERACGRGLIESYKDSLQIKVSNPQFLRLLK